MIYFYAKNGNFTNGWVFENGISTKSISPSTKEEYLKSKNLNFETELGTQNTGKQKLQVAANQFCYTSANPIYGLGCITVGDPPQTVCTPYIKGYYYTSFCLDVNIPTDGGFIPNPTNPGVPPTLPEVLDEPPIDTDEIRAFEADYKEQMSTAELAIYNNMSRMDQISYLVNAKTALDMAVSRFPNISQTDSKADAFRHAYFSLLNVKSLGLTLSTSLGNAHEENTNQSALSKQMDLFNNNIGRNAFTNTPPEAPY